MFLFVVVLFACFCMCVCLFLFPFWASTYVVRLGIEECVVIWTNSIGFLKQYIFISDVLTLHRKLYFVNIINLVIKIAEIMFS